MAFYQNLHRQEGKDGKNAHTAKEVRWSPVHYRSPRPQERARSAPWLDRLLGTGSSKVLNQSRASRPAPVKPRVSRPAVEMVGKPGQSLSPARKGMIRLMVGLGLLAWAGFALRPVVKTAWTKFSAHKKVRGKAALQAAKPALQAAEKDATLEAALVQPTPEGTPVARLKSGPMALCSAGGRWYEVDAEGRVSPSGGPEEKTHIGMPLISAGGIQQVVEKGVWVMKLNAAAEDLEGLFPLQPMLATEVAAIMLNEGGNVRVLTHDGSVAWLGQGHLQEKEARLAAVLADLAPKGRKAWQIDLRYEDSAVVRVASR